MEMKPWTLHTQTHENIDNSTVFTMLYYIYFAEILQCVVIKLYVKCDKLDLNRFIQK